MARSEGRYEGQPLLRLLECYVLWAIGALPEVDAKRLVEMTPKLRSIYGADGEWQDAIAKALSLPPNMPTLIRQVWAKNSEIARQNRTILPPQQFAEMFVDQNWRE